MNLALFSEKTGINLKQITPQTVAKAVKKGQITEQEGQAFHQLLKQFRKVSQPVKANEWPENAW